MSESVPPACAPNVTEDQSDSEPLSGVPLSLLHFVRDVTGSDLSWRALIEKLSATATGLLHAEGGAVLEMDAEQQSYTLLGACGSVARFAHTVITLVPGRSLVREAITKRRAVAANDPADERIHPDVHNALAVRNIAVAPILLDDRIVGLIGCVNTSDGAFTEQHLTLLDHLAAYGALVMRGQQLVARAESAADEARHRAEEAARAARANAILARTARDFADAGSRDALYRSLASVLGGELHAVGLAVYEANPLLRTARFDHQWGVQNANAEHIASAFWQTALGEVVQKGAPHFVEQLSGAAEHRMLSESLLESGVRSAALLPLVVEERPQGLLSVRFEGEHTFDPDERQLLADIAAQFALAFRNTIYTDELERRAQRLTVLARAQQQLTQLASEEGLPGGIAEAVDLVVPSAVCDILVTQGDALQRVVHLVRGQIANGELSPCADLALARETAESGVSRLASHLVDGIGVQRGTTELCAAVRFGQRTAGVIRLLSAPATPFDAQDLDLLTIIARHAGTAVETARLFALQDLQRLRAEAAAELARVTLHAQSLEQGAAELLQALDRYVPSIGKAIGVARARDGLVEYIAASGTLDMLRGHRPGATRGVTNVSPDGRPVEFPSLRELAPDDMRDTVPDEWTMVVPLSARDRILGVLLVTAPRQTPLLRRDRTSIERLSSSLSLALDALLLDEEERLASEREHLLATALTTINHPIFILDRVGVRYANPAAAREYGWSQAELMDMRFEDLVVGEDARQGLDTGSGVVESGVSLSNDLHRRRDGTDFPAAVTVSPLTGHDGDLLGQVVSVRNITLDRRLEEQLRTTEKMVALGELVGGVAHEINNPLTGISAFAQLLLEEELNDEQRESVQLIKQESDRAKNVINDLLLFARKTERGAGPVKVNTVIEQTVRLRAYPLRVANVQVRLELDERQPTVSGDAQKLQQVLLNVVSNAEYAMQDRRERVLTLRTLLDGDVVQIVAHDTGRGMTPEVQRRIFEPFFSSKPAGIGTGLGMSVTYGIITAHGGTIAVESEPEVGTTVTIRLPAVSA